MCRLLAYLGTAPAALSRYVFEPDHSLEVQAFAPREMLSGVVNADGFGVGWYAEDDPEPALYRSLFPLWSDATFRSIAPRIKSRAYFAALRNATPPLPSELSAVPPFASGRYLFMHNGAIDRFRETAMRPLRDSLSEAGYREVTGASDSETICACVMDRLRSGMPPKVALLDATAFVAEVCQGRGVRAALNLGLSDGERLVFSRYSTEGPANSLYYLAEEGAVIVSSERLDADERWREVPEGSVLTVERDLTVMVEGMPL
ncbi:TIGR03442: ergothioneine biosynthesis protein EgtC [Rubrobacter radiotolerans]|uniref:Gamma-glutamyl-hercynylcysteine sulfoxide hydrolase n=1 Tax=Rubrobacter radiotolerans TaxID=42256 RepID=A0A023X5H7_RUBRA|nr:ergothioneine biosynthesis protein EgtC [Rubrobacter radiotolerans]AHY47461.1 TIGR03442: ergothioneine biosynthesis protein EgtC [Rubrobacter radiotolerans]MDX5894864.1 ergothioneine biosynthesis protein EgtC [Rubrobacter radiotolerans]SMC06943.1 glutamine amidotransferase [Rubrobacter radiotolerans DSM 5868]